MYLVIHRLIKLSHPYKTRPSHPSFFNPLNPNNYIYSQGHSKVLVATGSLPRNRLFQLITRETLELDNMIPLDDPSDRSDNSNQIGEKGLKMQLDFI